MDLATLEGKRKPQNPRMEVLRFPSKIHTNQFFLNSKKARFMPKFESPSDRENEAIIGSIIARFLRVDLCQNEKLAPADFSSPDGKIQVEVRVRSNPKGQYPDVVLSASKVVELLRLKASYNKPKIYFAVAWTDWLGIVEIDFGTVELIPFYRNGSVGTHKHDVMVSLPTNKFFIICKRPRLIKSINWRGTSE